MKVTEESPIGATKVSNSRNHLLERRTHMSVHVYMTFAFVV